MRRLALLLFLGVGVSMYGQVDPELLAGMKARSIGPATMSGRVAAIDAVASDPNVVYVGASTGGVWKSVDGGVSWDPIFDDQPVAAIGAVAVFQPHPDLIWVGTGEGNPRNSASVGNGVYKSLDGGKTWKYLGLDKTERIARIVLHPSNPNIAWVAAMGTAWGENPERGVFKTEDGGATWKKVLYVDARTGAADLAMHPSNPNKLFAAMWDYRRWPWFFRSGGPGSGLHVSSDGGETWKKLTEDDGLPKGYFGRIGVAIAPSNPLIVYALVEAEKSAMLRSVDGGRTWKKINEESDIAPRPFYYADLRVDPADPNRVYSLWSQVTVSNDGGKTFETLIPFRRIHPDHHAMWINPANPRHIMEGNDGGVAISLDRGKTWRYVENLPLGQYYHISVDMERPYNVYGGMQDNGSWRGPSSVWENGGIRNYHWQEVGFGDGFATLAVQNEPTRGYSMSQEGYLMRWDARTGERKDIRPPAPDGVELRFNWNAAISADPFDPNTVYYGSQFVHKSSDRGDNWTNISPDLTTNNKDWQNQARSGGVTPDVTGAENFTTIMTIAPSAVQRGVIWVGTDDGRVQVTRDGGANWASVEANIKGVAKNSWAPHIEPSKFDAATAFVVFDDHRRANWTSYVFKTTDFGKTWTSLATKDLRGYALVLEQDPVNPDLLFLGTEFGLFVSTDGGRQWLQWKHGFPTVSAMAMIVHPRDHDLVIGTHGRSAYVIDDIAPLRTISRDTMSKPFHLFPVPDAQQYRVKQTPGSRFIGDAEFRADNRPYGALITYSLNVEGLPHPKDETERERKIKEREAKRAPFPISHEGVPQEVTELPKGPEEQELEQLEEAERRRREERGPEVEIEVTDASGKVIRKFKGPARLGVNRAIWNLRRDAFKEPPREPQPFRDDPSGPEVLPGTYGVTLKYKNHQAKGSIGVNTDPRFQIAAADREAKFAAILRAGEMQEAVAEAVDRIRKTRSDVDTVTAKLRRPWRDKEAIPPSEETAQAEAERPGQHPLTKSGKELKEKLDKLERELWIPPKTKGIVAETDALSKIGNVQSSLASSWDAPTAAQLTYLRQAQEVLEKALANFNKFFAEDVARYREEVRKSDVQLLPDQKPIQLKKP